MLTAARARSRGRAGFTIVELLVAITMTAIIAALALLSFRRVYNAAQSSEARQVLGQIRAGEESYRAEMLSYLSCSSSMTDYYPNATPNGTRWAWAQPTDTRYYSTGPIAGWKLLNVNPDGPVRYGYAVMATTGAVAPGLDPAFTSPPKLTQPTGTATPWFVAGARTEHTNASLPPSLAVTTSYDGRIYWENEGN